MGSDTEFAALAEPLRPQLLAHCYRMLGSIHDAEDLVQETYVRAWQGWARFEGRSTPRRWLYAIATRVCLTALASRPRRPLPSGVGPPSDDDRVAVAPRESSVAWLQPVPDALVGLDDPATTAAARAQVRLAFVAALQVLPARQRAVLTLRDVLMFRTVEVAGMLESTPAAVDSTLRRARARLAEIAPVADELPEPDDVVRALVARYVDAFTRADVDALTDLLRADVEMEMPPIPTWFSGRDAVTGFLRRRVLRRAGQWRLVPARANAQPGLLIHRRTDDGGFVPYGVQVLTTAGERIARITAFNEPGLVPTFGRSAGPTPRGSPSRRCAW